MKDLQEIKTTGIKTRQDYTANEERLAKYLYEVEGWKARDIVAKLGLTSTRIFYKWSQAGKWQRGRLAKLIEVAEFDARMERAKQIGIDIPNQMMKAKELMEAGTIIKEEVPIDDKGNTITQEIKLPDYKAQNEGLKRAMELTGTKIERTEIEHKGKQEIIHKYMLPKKKDIK